MLSFIISIFFYGFGIFEANMIRFRSDQLQFVPTQELSSYFLLAFILLIASIIRVTVYKDTIYVFHFSPWFWCTYYDDYNFVFSLIKTSLGY